MVDRPPSSISGLLQRNADTFPTLPAIIGETGETLSHRELNVRVTELVYSLNSLGLGRNDRVAIVLPPGPDLAVTFLAVAAGATAAPLNPGYKEAEFRFYLEDMQAGALLVTGDGPAEAVSAATALGIRILELANGSIHLTAGAVRPLPAIAGGIAEISDLALLLHTSGTTSRPKLVPLTHGNLTASARHIAASLHLHERDRCLNVMPLYHIHGLVACVLGSLHAGGSVVCTSGFEASRFFLQLDHFKPSWYSAVPTIHQAIVAAGTAKVSSSLRFIRSSSSALAPTVMAQLESTFGVPVVEAYGMTEAAHQMACNPLPPGIRKPGSVGQAAGPDITVLTPEGDALPAGQLGEVAIRGPNVSAGYLANPEANRSSYHKGWFRTGDQGYIDPDGYLFLTGRLKEIINRGGEKVSPREIDEALLRHPAIAQAVAFALPHPTLGEDVVAAVVVKPGSSCAEPELREFALAHLPAFKAPTRIVIVPQIPKGPTGKIQRIGLASKLTSALATPYEAPQTPTEILISDVIKEVLGASAIGRHDNFFIRGGDSLRAVQVLLRLESQPAVKLPVGLLFRHPTPALLAARLDLMREEQELQEIARQLAELPAAEQAQLLRTLDAPASQVTTQGTTNGSA